MAKVEYSKLLVYFKKNSPADLDLLEWARKTAEFRGDSVSDLFKDALRYFRKEL